MAEGSDRFLDALRSQGQLCDDCIYPLAGFSRRQGANQLGRRLQTLGLVDRSDGICSECHGSKIVNRISSGSKVIEATGRVPAAIPHASVSRTWNVTPAQFEACVRDFVDGTSDSNGRQPDERYASFDYCFNYFQSFREAGKTTLLAGSDNIQASCLQLGFYLASWGLLRGSSHLLQKSVRYLTPVVELIAETDADFWEIDAHDYEGSNIERLLDQASKIRLTMQRATDTLVTKIMLGVFGCVPAFDTYFTGGFGVSTFGAKALNKVADFYQDHAELIDACRVPTIDFVTGEPTSRLYTRAKVIDMAFFVRGMA